MPKEETSLTDEEYEEALLKFKDDSAAFFVPGILLTAIELGVFSALDAGATDAESVSRITGGDARSTDVLLTALEPIGYVTQREGKFYNTAFSSTALVRGRSKYEGESALFSLWCMRQIGELAEVVRSGAPRATYEEAVLASGEQAGMLARAMDQVSRGFTTELLEAVDMRGVRRVLDVGGACGTLLMALLADHPEASGTVLELPNTAAEARTMIAERGYSDRIDVVDGDFRECSLGEDFDVILFSNVFHLCGEDLAERLVMKSAAALAPGGRLVVKDMFGREDGTETTGLSMYSVLMLLISRSGRLHRQSRYDEWLARAGLGPSRRIDCWARSSILIAEKPGA